MDFCNVNPFVRNIMYVEAPVWEHYPRKGIDCRIFYVTEGSVKVHIGGSDRIVAKGGMLYIPSGCEYALVDTSSDFAHYVVNFDFTQDDCEKERAFFPRPSFEYEEDKAICVPQIGGFDFFGDFIYMEHCAAFEELFRELYKTFSDRRLMYRSESSGYMKIIVCAMAERVRTQVESSNGKIAEAAISYIKRNYADPQLDNEEIGAYLGYHSFYVNKLVKRLTGKSVHKYLLLYRLTQAEGLLIYSEKSISDIATACGFSVYDVFYSAFKREYGVTPTKFRQENRRRA